MDVFKKATNAVKKILMGNEIASWQSDPYFYNALNLLPNPDAILRKMGKTQEVFEAIMSDAHVMGELRPIRANIIGFEWRILPASDSVEDMAAFEFCQTVYSKKPAPSMGWSDVFWNMQQAILRGYRVHEIVWELQNGLMTPTMLIDRPNKRFVYGNANELRVITKANIIEGEPVPDYKFLVSRHMPSYDNPYGVALLSSCFWPYTFKHNGFRWFSRFCEKYGIPWAVGKYPDGTSQAKINELATNLAQMVEDAVAAIPDAGKVELIESGSSGQALPQERLIELCNKEMSKCLTSQTLASEITGNGSYAAAKVHSGREQDNGAADRKIVEDTNNQFLTWITELNFSNAQPPRFEFYEESEARQEWVDVFKDAREFLDIPAQFAHERLQIPQPKDGESVLPKASQPLPIAQFASPLASSEDDPTPVTTYSRQLALHCDPLIEDWVKQIKGHVDNGQNLEALRDVIINLYSDLKAEKLVESKAQAFACADLAGQFDVIQESKD